MTLKVYSKKNFPSNQYWEVFEIKRGPDASGPLSVSQSCTPRLVIYYVTTFNFIRKGVS